MSKANEENFEKLNWKERKGANPKLKSIIVNNGGESQTKVLLRIVKNGDESQTEMMTDLAMQVGELEFYRLNTIEFAFCLSSWSRPT